MGTPSPEYTQIGPGFAAFVVIFLLAIALWLLLKNMNKRLRNASYREQREEREDVAADRGEISPRGR